MNDQAIYILILNTYIHFALHAWIIADIHIIYIYICLSFLSFLFFSALSSRLLCVSHTKKDSNILKVKKHTHTMHDLRFCVLDVGFAFVMRHVFSSQIDIFLHKIISVVVRTWIDAVRLKTIFIFVFLCFSNRFFCSTFLHLCCFPLVFELCYSIAEYIRIEIMDIFRMDNKDFCFLSSFPESSSHIANICTLEFQEFHVKLTFDGIKFPCDQHGIIGHIEHGSKLLVEKYVNDHVKEDFMESFVFIENELKRKLTHFNDVPQIPNCIVR